MTPLDQPYLAFLNRNGQKQFLGAKLRVDFRRLPRIGGNADTLRCPRARTLILCASQDLQIQTNRVRLQTRRHFRRRAREKLLGDGRTRSHHRIQEKKNSCPCKVSIDVFLLFVSSLVFIPADSLVNCPVCGDSVEFQAINTHMDGPDCGQKQPSKMNNPSNPNAKMQWSKLLGGKSDKGKTKQNR